MSPLTRYLALLLAGFASGGVLYSYHLPLRIKGVNVVALSEDHNPGAANAVKYAGLPLGLCCLALDMLKGYAPIYIACRSLDIDILWFALIPLAPVLGHAWAPLYRFRGGKAIAVSFGALLGLFPHSMAIFLLVGLYLFFSFVAVVNPNERRTIVVFCLFALTLAASSIYTRRFAIALSGCLIAAVVVSQNSRDA